VGIFLSAQSSTRAILQAMPSVLYGTVVDGMGHTARTNTAGRLIPKHALPMGFPAICWLAVALRGLPSVLLATYNLRCITLAHFDPPAR
jgi:hypothetical protein